MGIFGNFDDFDDIFSRLYNNFNRPVKDMKPFENSFFTKMENLKEINKIVATLSVEKYLPITSYIDFFRGTAEIEKRGIFINHVNKYSSLI